MRDRRGRAGVTLAVLVALAPLPSCRSDPEVVSAAPQRGPALVDDTPRPPAVLARQTPFACFEAAVDQTSLTRDQAVALCRAALSMGPVECFSAARSQTTLLTPEALTLCSCAASTAPVDCFVQGREQTALPALTVVGLCAAIRTGLAPGCGGY